MGEGISLGKVTMWMYLVMQIPVRGAVGWAWPYTRPIYLWLLVSVCLLTTLAIALLIGEERKRARTSRAEDGAGDISPTATTPAATLPHEAAQAKTKIKNASRYVGMVLVGALLGGMLGWLWRDHQFSSPPRIYMDVLVRERYDERSFELAPARMKPWKATTCAPVDWQAGEKMKFLAFQQRLGCKDVTVAGWYEFYTDGSKRMKFTEEIANVGY